MVKLTLTYMFRPMVTLKADGVNVAIVDANEKCRPRFERFLREGIPTQDHPVLSECYTPPAGVDDGHQFLIKVAEYCERCYGLTAVWECVTRS